MEFVFLSVKNLRYVGENHGVGAAMMVISDVSYAALRADSFYHFLNSFLFEKSRSPIFKNWLRDAGRCQAIWHGLFNPSCATMELALRHAYALSCAISGEVPDKRFPDCISSMEMKARLDGCGHLPFSCFDLANA